MDFNIYYQILTKITSDELTHLLRLLLEKKFYAPQIPDYYNSVLKHKVKFSKKEEELILNSPRGGYSKFDLSLLVKILRNCCDGKLETYLISISRIRNELFHLPNTNIRKKEFEIWFRELSDIGEAIEKYLNVPNSIVQTFHSILSASRDPIKERFQAIEKKLLELHAETLSNADLEKKLGELKPVLHDLAVQTEDHQRKLHELNTLLYRVGKTLQPRHENSRCEERPDPINERLQAIEKKLLELHAETLSNVDLEKILEALNLVLHSIAVQTEDHQRKLHELKKLLYRVGKTLQPRHEDSHCEERLEMCHDFLEQKVTSSSLVVKNQNKQVGKTLQPRTEGGRGEERLEINNELPIGFDQLLQLQQKQKGTHSSLTKNNDYRKEQSLIESSNRSDQNAKPDGNTDSRGQPRVVYEDHLQNKTQHKEKGINQQNVISAVSSGTCNASIMSLCKHGEETLTVSTDLPTICIKATKIALSSTQQNESIKSNNRTSLMIGNPPIPLRNTYDLAQQSSRLSQETKQLSKDTVFSLQEHSLITNSRTNYRFKSQTEILKQTTNTPWCSPELDIHPYLDLNEKRGQKISDIQRGNVSPPSSKENNIHISLKRRLSERIKHFCLSTGQFLHEPLHNGNICNGLNNVLLLLKEKMSSLHQLDGLRSFKNDSNCYESLNINLRDDDDVAVTSSNLLGCLEGKRYYDGDVIILHTLKPQDCLRAQNFLHDLKSNLVINGDLQDIVMSPGKNIFHNVQRYFQYKYIMVLITKYYEQSESALFRHLVQILIIHSLMDPCKQNRIVPVLMEKLKSYPDEFLPMHPLKYPIFEGDSFESYYQKLHKLFPTPVLRRTVSCID